MLPNRYGTTSGAVVYASEGAPSLVEQLCKALEPYDERTAARVQEMLGKGEIPVQLSSVDVTTGKGSRIKQRGCCT